jgi:hypothetical protein
MALKLNVGVSKKLGLPEYSSIGASCNVEVELDPSLFHGDLAGFHERVRLAYVACHQAVHDELARLLNAPTPGRAVHPRENGHPGRHSDYSASEPPPRLATSSQLRAIAAIAIRHNTDLAPLLQGEFGIARPEELTVREASRLIDRLNAGSGFSPSSPPSPATGGPS